MLMVLVVAGWLACGVLVYGVEKDWYRRSVLDDRFLFPNTKRGYNWKMEMGCLTISLLGPVALFASWLGHSANNDKMALTFRMPEKLCARRG